LFLYILEIHIITIFPEMFDSVFAHSIIKKAVDKSKVKIKIHNLRNWASGKHRKVDDKPFGGGPGMVMKVEPFAKAINEIKSELGNKKTITILTSAKGKQFNQKQAISFSKYEAMIILCGHYEGVDERVAEYYCDLELSIGKYVLTGGEIPAMIISDAVIRLIPGVVGNAKSLEQESFISPNFKEYPQYTRPEQYLDNDNILSVPEILLSGNHQEIEKWRNIQAQG
jgi:tRNA (guanine37-N1)-methyltransferase